MLVYAVVSPAVFEVEQFKENDHYRDHLNLFFRNLNSNTVMLLDPKKSLLEDIENTVKKLPIKFRQELEIQIAELYRKQRRKSCRSVVKLNADKCNTDANQKALQRCKIVALAANADAVFLTADEIEELERSGSEEDAVFLTAAKIKELERSGSEEDAVFSKADKIKELERSGRIIRATRMAEYSWSEFEEKRKKFMEDLPAIDELDSKELAEIIIRVTRFSTWIRVYDKQIGKGNNLSNFQRGIEFIIQQWLENAHYPPEFVEIFTIPKEKIFEDDERHIAGNKRDRIRDAHKKVQRFEHKLASSSGVKVKIKVKGTLQHARYLETQTAVVLFEQGFDFLHDTGEPRQTTLHLELRSADCLKNARKQPDYEFI